MFGNWLNTKEIDEVADAIVADLVQFALSRKLNICKKARLGNRVRWALREAGYAPEFTDATLASRQAGKPGG